MVFEVQSLAKDQKNNAVRIYSIVNRPKFLAAWNIATEQEKNELLILVKCNKAREVSEWVKKITASKIETMTVKQLRNEASRLGIPLWGTYSKYLLMRKVREAHERNQAKKNPGEIHP